MDRSWLKKTTNPVVHLFTNRQQAIFNTVAEALELMEKDPKRAAKMSSKNHGGITIEVLKTDGEPSGLKISGPFTMTQQNFKATGGVIRAIAEKVRCDQGLPTGHYDMRENGRRGYVITRTLYV